MLLKGSYYHSIDSKGRVTIPSKLKKAISEAAEDTLIMLPGRDRCIEVYPKDVWMKLEENLSKLNLSDPKLLALVRYYTNNAHEDEMDSQGRILIPPTLKQYAQSATDVVIAGTGKIIEIWNPDMKKSVVPEDRDKIDPIAAEHLPWIY